jgi:hypothetical protein
MRNDIAQTVSGCDQCQSVRQAKPVETPFLYSSASRPLEAISVDLCKSKGRHFLVAADCFSGYPWVARLTSKTTRAVIAIMEKWFCKLGWPQRLGSDDGHQFRHEFEEWCAANHITFELSSARNPASNGLAEATVKRVKHLLEKIKGPSSFSRALLALRNTPLSNGRASPAQALFKQDLHMLGLPTVASAEPVLRVPTRRTAMLSDRVRWLVRPSACTLPQSSMVRVSGFFDPDAKRWSGQATVMKIRRHGTSVWLRTASGCILVCNQRFLKPLATTQPGKKKVAENSLGTKMVTRLRGKKMVATKS